MKPTAIVTGAAGFLGSHLCEWLLKLNYRVVGVDNFATGMEWNKKFLENLGADFRFVEADCIKPWSWWQGQVAQDWQKNLKYVFHFASPASPPHYQRLGLETMWVNTLGLKHGLEVADTHQARVVFASTSEVYGDPDVSPQKETYWGNVNSFGVRSCYDEAKRFGESLIFTHNRRHHTKHGMVRIFNTYGPRMNPADARVVINFLVQALRGEKLTVYGDGSQTRSFCYVDDLIQAIWKYAEVEADYPINIGNPREFTIRELADVVQGIFSEKELAIAYEPLPQDDPKQRRPDISLALDKLNPWKPEVSLQEGLRRTLDWLVKQDLV